MPAETSVASPAEPVADSCAAAGDVARRDLLDALNPEQRAAAGHGERDAGGRFAAGPLLVVAGAGTGKTATLAHRVAHLVMQGVDPMRILLLTFSRRAAKEMTRRAERLVAQALAGQVRAAAGASEVRHPAVAVRLPWAGTFHSIGARLLREHAERVGLDASFGILDRGDAADLIDVVRHELGLSSTRQRFPRKDTCLAIYSQCVNSGWPLERVLFLLAGTMTGLSALLAAVVSPWFLLLTGFVSLNQLLFVTIG
ncbi:MAG: ATP-dependent helicase, partial [Burkholderiales bacterium]